MWCRFVLSDTINIVCICVLHHQWPTNRRMLDTVVVMWQASTRSHHLYLLVPSLHCHWSLSPIMSSISQILHLVGLSAAFHHLFIVVCLDSQSSNYYCYVISSYSTLSLVKIRVMWPAGQKNASDIDHYWPVDSFSAYWSLVNISS